MYKIATILCAGADGAGGNTLAYQFNKMNNKEIQITCFCNEKGQYDNASNIASKRKYSDFCYFNSFVELYKKIKEQEFDAFIILTGLFNKDKQYEDYIRFIKKSKCKKVLFNIDRTKRTAIKTLINSDYVNLFDKVVVISKEVKKFIKELSHVQCELLDVNLYKFHNISPILFENKKNEISYFGRFANFKGWNKLFDYEVENKELFKKYNLSFEGGSFSGNENGFSSTIGIISSLCNDIHSKEIKGLKEGKTKIHFDYETYDEDMKEKCIHLYPSYNLKDMLKRARYKKFVIFPIGYGKKIEQVKSQFEVAMEYAWLEMIDIGTSIICSKSYAESYLINNKRLIDFDCGMIFINHFNEIPDKINEYEKNYDENVKKLKNFFIDHYDSIGKFNRLVEYIKT